MRDGEIGLTALVSCRGHSRGEHDIQQLSKAVCRDSIKLDCVVGNQALCGVRLCRSEHVAENGRVAFESVSVDFEDRVLYLFGWHEWEKSPSGSLFSVPTSKYAYASWK